MVPLGAQSAIKSPNSNLSIISKNGRTPLGPKYQQHQSETTKQLIDIKSTIIINSNTDGSNKENLPPSDPIATKKKAIEIETETMIDASLAEELQAIRERLERMRLDKENTEKLLQDRQMALDMHMDCLLKRGQIQSLLEIEVDRLYRLNQIITSSTEVTPIRSLREKEQERKMKEDMCKDIVVKAEEKDNVAVASVTDSGCSTPLVHTPSNLDDGNSGDNNEIKYLSSEFELENS